MCHYSVCLSNLVVIRDWSVYCLRCMKSLVWPWQHCKIYSLALTLESLLTSLHAVCQVSLILIFRFAYTHIQKYEKPNVANYDRWPYLVVIWAHHTIFHSLYKLKWTASAFYLIVSVLELLSYAQTPVTSSVSCAMLYWYAMWNLYSVCRTTVLSGFLSQ